MLIACVIVYMMATVAIGIYASSRVKDSKDFMVAGRSLPLYMNFACVFATWFGAETVLSVSATFAHKGMGHVSGDPFGASLCLILVAFFFAKTFYRLELLTIGDYYHKRYGKFVEVVTSLGIASSYLGWTSAQLSALGLVIDVLFPQLTLNQSILIGAVIVTIYTMFGGMWSVALTDVVQTAAIVVGLLIVATLLGQRAGGFEVVIAEAQKQGKLDLFPHVTAAAWFAFIGEFITMALGSIPQQDVFQRVTSAKNERTAFIGTLGGGLFYFAFAFVPMFIAFAATVVDPSNAALFDDSLPGHDPGDERYSHLVSGALLWCGSLGHPFDGQRHVTRPGQRADGECAAAVHTAFQ
jgi:solute:Na+ symporter, SSS family